MENDPIILQKCTVKICTKCNIEKEITFYHKNKNEKDGYMNICKTCRSLSRKNQENVRCNDNKECPKCKKLLSHTFYSSDKSSKDGLQTYCKSCHKINEIKYYKNGGKELYFNKNFRDLKGNAEKRNIEVNITINDIKNLYVQQNEKCVISGIKMTTEFIPGDDKWSRIHNMSVDRIDSNKSYTKDNIQLVCCMINIMKWDLKQDDFINICKTIYLHNKK